MTAHINELAARTASAAGRLSFNLFKYKQAIALEESDLSSYANPDTRHSPKYRHRYSARSKVKRQQTPKKD
jgi:hypothetical protein